MRPRRSDLQEEPWGAALLHHLQQLPVGDHAVEDVHEALALHLLPVLEAHLALLHRALEQERVERVLVLQVALALPDLGLEERGLGDVEMPSLDELLHLPVEEGQEQGADVAAVHVRVAHHDDAVVTQLRHVEVVGSHPGAEGGDDVEDLLAREGLVEARFLDVQDLAPQGQHGLELAVAALLGGAAGRVAFHEVELAQLGVALLALGELAGQPGAVEGALATREVAGLARGLPAPRGVDDLLGDPPRVLGPLFEEGREALVHQALDDALHLRVAELALGLTLELRVRHLDRHHRGEPLASVVALDLPHVLELGARLREGVEAAGESSLEAREVGAPVVGVDVVREAEDVLVVAVVPLHRDLDDDAFARALEEDRRLVQHLLVAVQVLDEARDAPFVLEALVLAVALVVQGDEDAPVQEAELAQPLGEGVGVVDRGLEDLGIGLEGDLGAPLVRDPGVLETRHRLPALVALPVDLLVAPDLHLEALGEGVDHRDAHPVKSPRDLVGPLVELASGVELREHHLGRVHPDHGGVGAHGNPATVVDHRHRVVDVDGDPNLGAVARERLVHGVVDHLVDEVVQARLSGAADVHGGADAYGLEPLQDADVPRPVAGAVSAFAVALVRHGSSREMR